MKLESAKTSNLTAIAAFTLSAVIFIQSCNSNNESHFKAIENRFDRIDTTLVRMNNCIKHIEKDIKDIEEDIKEIKETQKEHSESLEDLKVRVGILEKIK